ncbi:MAG TPA: ATP-binding protein [Nostocaceae cyanobacterium]|nr:ATP-binding protein [Nostocaceae cyanobacterium]
MNSGNSALFQSDSQLEIQPELELNFADFLVNQAVNVAFCLGKNAQFIYVNKATCQLFEYSQEELLSMRLHDLDLDGSLCNWSEQWQHLINQHHLYFKSRYRTKTGRIFLADVNLTYIQVHNQKFSCAFLQEKSNAVVDLNVNKWTGKSKQNQEYLQQEIIALQKKELELEQTLEKEKKQNELRSHFVAMICHQFRSPLNVVSFSNSILQRYIHDWKEEKVQPLLENIQMAVEQLSQMMDNILLLAKTETSNIIFEPEPLDLLQFCQDFMVKVPILYHRPINFINQVYHLTVWIDKKLIEIVLHNLLENAVKYSPVGSVVDLVLSYEEGNVIFQVKDRGLGIPKGELERLFEPFYRGSNVEDVPGTGLGLSIVKTLVDLHQGEVSVKSEVNVGTTFTVKLPSMQLNLSF